MQSMKPGTGLQTLSVGQRVVWNSSYTRPCAIHLKETLVLLGAFIVFVLLAPSTTGAQVAGGSITGTVVDASGTALPGAQVSISNLETGFIRTVATDSQGFYT